MFTQIINKVAFAANTDKRYISDDICFMTVRLPVSVIVIVIVIVIVTFVFFGIAGRSILVSRFAAAFPYVSALSLRVGWTTLPHMTT